jgi:hypothetical protein
MSQIDPAPLDPGSISLDELRRLRSELQSQDDVVSYVRRIAQARLDLIRAELRRRERNEPSTDLAAELREILSHHLNAGPARPPRPEGDLGDHRFVTELESICAQGGFGRLAELDAEAARAL